MNKSYKNSGYLLRIGKGETEAESEMKAKAKGSCVFGADPAQSFSSALSSFFLFLLCLSTFSVSLSASLVSVSCRPSAFPIFPSSPCPEKGQERVESSESLSLFVIVLHLQGRVPGVA
jgi:hypothetical protein